MSTCTRSARKQVVGGKRSSSTDQSPRACSPSFALALPRLDKVASRFSTISKEEATFWAKVALLWMNSGEAVEEGNGLIDTVQRTMLNWAKRHTSELKHLGTFGIVVGAEPGDVDWSAEEHSADQDDAPDNKSWYVGMDVENHGRTYKLADKTCALEHNVPGLGQTALHWLCMSGYRTTTFFMPEVARQIGEYMYWQGASTQEDWRDEIKHYSDESEIADLFSPNDFDAGFPSWVINPSEVLTTGELKSLSRDEGMPEVVRIVANLVRRIRAMTKRHVTLTSSLPHEQVYFGAILRWTEQDSLMRVSDDLIDAANQSGEGYTTYCGIESVALESQEEFNKWKRHVEQGFRLLNLADCLIDLLADRIET